jgi:Flp pilus assembly protein TadB
MTGPTTIILAGLLGASGGTGILCLLAAVVPPAAMDLARAWYRITTRENSTATDDTAAGSDDADGPLTALLERIASWTQRVEHPWIAAPTTDLDLLGLRPRAVVARRLAWAAAAFTVTTGLAVLAASTGGNLPVPVPVVVLLPLGAAVAASLVPMWTLRSRAAAARDEFRRVLAAYLDLVAQERAAGGAPTTALLDATAVSDHPVFVRLRRTLTHALHLVEDPWEALHGLARRIDVSELADLADIAATAATGAAVYTTLTTQAASLREKTRAEDHAQANAITERLTLPVSVLLIGFLGLVLYPTLTQLLT